MSRDLFLAGGGNTTKQYDIPLEKFEIAYIQSATDVKELEKILKVLRSGAEGSFPHLEEAAENRLVEIDPENRTLRKSAAIGTRSDLQPDSRDRLTSEINDFLDDISNVDQQLRKRPPGGATRRHDDVPVRGVSVSINKENVKSTKSPKPKDYREWEKIEKSLNPDEDVVGSDKATPTRPRGVDTQVDVSGKTDIEKRRMADMEKEKGNEYFTAGDYEAAVSYYTRSLNIIASPAAYNNRALVHLKREHYNKCISDCQSVLEAEPDNVKALLRRGTSYKAQSEYTKAKRDFSRVLELEPQNLRAEKLLKETEQAWRTKGKKLVIDEVETEEEERTNVNGTDEHVNGRVNGLKEEKESEKKPDSGKPTKVESENRKGESESEKPKPRRIVIEESDSEDDDEEFQDAVTDVKPEVETKVRVNEEVAHEEASSSDAASVKTASTDVSSDSDPANSTDTSPLHQPQTPPRPATPPPQRPILRTLPLPDHLSALKQKGNDAFRSGQFAQALDLYTQILTKLTQLPDQEVNLSTIYNNRASAHYKVGDCRAAIEDCDLSLKHVPHNVKALLRRAYAYEALEKYKNAYRDFKHALGVDAGMDQAQQGLSRCRDALYRDLGKQWRDKVPETVVNSYEIPLIVPLGGAMTQPDATTTPPANTKPEVVNKPVKPEPVRDEPPPLEDVTPTLQSAPPPKHANKTPPKSQPTKPESSSKQPANSNKSSDAKSEPVDKESEHDAIKIKGNQHVGKNQYKEAIDCYTRCLALFQNRSAVFTNRALCYLKVNQPHEAISDCDKALELEESNVKAWFRRALARKMINDYRNCMSDLLQVLRIDSNNTAAKKELEVVKKAYQETFAKEQEERKKEDTKKKGQSKKEQKQQKQPQQQSQKQEQQQRQSQQQQQKQEQPKQQQQQQASSGKKKKPVIEVVSETPTTAEQTTESKSTDVKPPPTKKENHSKKSKKNAAKPVETPAPVAPPVVETPTIPKIANPESPYEFMQAWNSLKGSKDMASYAGLLDQIQPRHLRKLLGNKLDSEILTTVLRAIHEHTLKTDMVRSYHLLHHLRHVERFDMATMFMNNLDKVIVRDALEHMSGDSKCPGSKTDLASLRKAYKIG